MGCECDGIGSRGGTPIALWGDMSISFYIATADSTDERMDYDRTLPENDELNGCQINLANANAKNLLRAVGLNPEPSGSVFVQDLAELRRATVLALNTTYGRSGLVRERYAGRGAQGALVLDNGTTDDYAERTLRRFLVFLARASELGRHIYWG